MCLFFHERKAANVHSYHGIATHYLHSSSLPDLEHRLAELTIPDYASFKDRLNVINATISEFTTGLPHDQPIALAGNIRNAIDRCFQPNNLEGIIEALEKEKVQESDGPKRESAWATKTLKTIKERSPTSLKVTVRQLELGQGWDISSAFQREYEIASSFMEHPDFVEGVSAKLLSKPPRVPTWQPASFEEVSSDNVDHMLRPSQGNQRLQLLNPSPTLRYTQYPHSWLGLPKEEQIQEYVQGGDRSIQDVLGHFMSISEKKLGVTEVVGEILARKTRADGEFVRWLGAKSEEASKA